jgi:hypothetical protein
MRRHRAKSRGGAPQSMNMGTIVSPRHYEVATDHALQPASPRWTAISRHALAGTGTHAPCRGAATSELGPAIPNYVSQLRTGRCRLMRS